MDQISIKTPNPNCPLYWCLIKFIDWRYSQSCWYFRPLLWTSAPLTFRFFQESPSPKPLIITLGSFQIFSTIRGDIHKSRCTTDVSDTGGKFAASINDASGKFATSINDTSGKFCHQFRLCCWHWWQTIGTISGCRHLKVNLKAKFIYMFPLLPKGDQIKLLNIFLIEDFFHLPPVSLAPLANLELRISPRIFEQIRNCAAHICTLFSPNVNPWESYGSQVYKECSYSKKKCG